MNETQERDVHNSVEAKEPAPALSWSRSAPQASAEL